MLLFGKLKELCIVALTKPCVYKMDYAAEHSVTGESFLTLFRYIFSNFSVQTVQLTNV